MYAVVYKDRVIVGPMDWNRGIFSGALSKNGITDTLPRVAPEILPLVLNADARICNVVENRPEINSLVEYYYGPLWDTSGEVVVANYEVHDSPIEFARINLKNQAADERYKKEITGTTLTIQGTEITIDTNRGSRDIFVQKYLLMGEADTVNWKFPEGWLTLTKADLGQVVAAGVAHVQSAFDWELAIGSQVDAATTKEQLLAIEIIAPTPVPVRE